VSAAVGQQIIITIPSNATTGYAWELATLDTAVVENTDQTYITPVSDLAGAGGWERWTFKAIGAGSTTLRLEYRRSWEPDTVDPADTFEITVNIDTTSL